MIFASIDLNKKSLDEFLESLKEIRNSKFDGVEICLWEDMTSFSKEIHSKLKKIGLKSNVHGDLMKIEYGLENCIERLINGLKFSKSIKSNFFITHPIKPYIDNLQLSKGMFEKFDESFLIETVSGIDLQSISLLKRPLVLDVGSVIKNEDYDKIGDYSNIKWVHIHDMKWGEDHFPLGEGEIDFNFLIKKFSDRGFTIELGNKFRKWVELKEGYMKSIDFLNNSLIFNKSYGKNVRLKHLVYLTKGKKFRKIADFGCGEGYLLHNIPATEKKGYDRNPNPAFNDISYYTKDITSLLEKSMDLIICSEVIEHIKDDRKIIKNIYNSLRCGGFIFLSTINRNTSRDKLELDKQRGHIRRYGIELKHIMEQYGFKTVAFYPFRSKHYYENKNNLQNYNIVKDIQSGAKESSGLIYFGFK